MEGDQPKGSNAMPRSIRTRSLAAALAATAALGAGAGAAVYAAFASGGTKTIVQQVAVGDSQPASNTGALTVNEIYRRAYRGVVEITVTSTQSNPIFGGSQAQQGQGSGFVYDAQGDIVTDQHVVAGAQSISVKFWNGASY